MKIDIDRVTEYNQHFNNLKMLGYTPDSLRPLYYLEHKAHTMAENECNGYKEYTDEQWNGIEKRVRALFSKYLNGLILNGDPRGYTLKIDADILKSENIKLYQDWGGYGILCPDFN